MKRRLFSVSVLTAACVAMGLVSCDKVLLWDKNNIGEISFSLQSTASGQTRGAAEGDETASVALDEEGLDKGLMATEVVESLDNELFPADGVTRGTPAYTQNVTTLYKNFNAVGYNGNTVHLADAAFELKRGSGDAVTAKHTYPDDKGWPASGSLTFFCRMPVTDCDALKPAYNGTNRTITFARTQPTTAAAQKDMLFAVKTLTTTGTDHNVTFCHPFTGVKFRLGTLEDTNMKGITRITLSGLYNQGTCTISPLQSGQKSADCVAWSSLTGATSCTASFTNSQAAGRDLSGKQGYPSSFDSEGVNTKALNDDAFTQTFFLIPQTIGDDVKLTFDILYTDGTTETRTVDFGQKLREANGKAASWKAGELRTYTLGVKKDGTVDIVLVINGSDSMGDSKSKRTYITNSGLALLDKVKTLQPDFPHRISIVSYCIEVKLLLDWTQDKAANRTAITTALNDAWQNEFSAERLDFGLAYAAMQLDKALKENPKRKKVVIVMTDTGDEDYEYLQYAAVYCAGLCKTKYGAKVYSLSVTSSKNNFMNYVSSNYPTASANVTSSTSDGYRNPPFDVNKLWSAAYMEDEGDQDLAEFFDFKDKYDSKEGFVNVSDSYKDKSGNYYLTTSSFSGLQAKMEAIATEICK